MPRPRRWALSAVLLGVAGGCQLEPARDLGQGVEEQSLPVVANPPSDTPFGVPASDFAGRWVGSVEDPLALGGERGAYVFPSGSSAIQIELDVSGERVRVDGRIVFGAGTPPPLPTDRDRGFPTDVSYIGLGYFNRLPGGPTNYVGPLPPHEGFEYRLLDAMYESERGPGNTLADGVLRLSYDSQEVLQPWCELQTPEPDGVGGHRCAGGDNYYFEDGRCSVEQNNLEALLAGLSDEQIQGMSAEDWARINEQVVRALEPIDCDKLFLCVTQRCACDAASCRANISDFLGVSGRRASSPSYAELTLRKTADGAGLIGVFNNAVFANERQLSVPVGVVHFDRAN
jgi:hypothetical protein